MIKIAPSILSANFAQIKDDILRINSWGVDYIHCDVMDGRFVPQISFGQQMIKAIKPLTDLPLDVHLMVENPQDIVQSIADAGADIITFHVEACTHSNRLLNTIKSLGCKAGIVLNPSTPLSDVSYLIEYCDIVLLMSVNPGFGGQKFIPNVSRKLQQLEKMREALNLNFEIEVDGGIDANTSKVAIANGANILVAGNSIFSATDPAAMVKILKNE